MTREQASSFARLALKGLSKEYPNKPADILNGDQDVRRPRSVHPAFYGCFDWHSSVHGHWMLVRVLRLFPNLPEKQQIRTVLAEHLTARNLQAEADSLARPNAQSFERPYGWAWLLKLAEELHEWDDPDAREWSKNLKPLTDTIVARFLSYFPRQTYPMRTGVHANTAFALSFALDYARAVDHQALRQLIEERSRSYFGQDAGIPAAWEPDGADFFSPSLMEADLMRRVLPLPEYREWLRRLSAGPGQGRTEDAVRPGHGDRSHRSAAGPPGRSQPEPGVVPAPHRRRPSPGRRGQKKTGGVGLPARRGGSGPRRRRRLCRGTLVGFVRGVPAVDAVTSLTLPVGLGLSSRSTGSPSEPLVLVCGH